MFAKDEEIKTWELPVEGQMRMVAADLGDKRIGALLDTAIEGKDFEFIV